MMDLANNQFIFISQFYKMFESEKVCIHDNLYLNW